MPSRKQCCSQSPHYGQLHYLATKTVRGTSGWPVASPSPPLWAQASWHFLYTCCLQIPHTSTYIARERLIGTYKKPVGTYPERRGLSDTFMSDSHTQSLTTHSPHSNTDIRTQTSHTHTHTNLPVLVRSPVRCPLPGIPCPIPSELHGHKVRDSGLGPSQGPRPC